MIANKKCILHIVALVAFNCLVAGGSVAQPQASQPIASENQAVRKIGTIKSINSTAITLKSDAGGDVTAIVQDGARIARIAPGERDLKNAVPATLHDLQPGDRILVGGKAAPDGTLLAFSLVLVKQTDVTQKQSKEREDWQKRGVGGIVKSIDTGTGDITVAITPAYSVIVKTSSSTTFLRYSEDSVRFADAKPSNFNDIKTGDQLRARGNRSPEQKELTAELVVSGSFRNIAGTLLGIDVANGMLTIKDVLAKKTVVVKITPESRLQKLPPTVAQRIALLLKKPDHSSSGSTGDTAPSSPAPPPDLQQILSRAPAVTLAEMEKDAAVIIISTPGTGNSTLKAITLLSGAEPILSAEPQGRAAAALLSSWNLNAALSDATAPSQ